MPLVCEVVKETLLRAAQNLVQDSAGRPMVTSKSCDGTPITVSRTQAVTQPGGKRVRWTGKCGVEFLVANQFLRSDIGAAGAMKTAVLLAEPTHLEHCKNVPAILLACRQHWRRLRDLGHLGCAIEHYCWDRLGIKALEAQTRQWHAQQPLPPLPADADPEVVKLTEFVCVTACALHDAHNSLKWAMSAWLFDKELIRDVYIGFESLRRSSDLISKYLYQWLGGVLQPQADRGTSWVEDRLSFWMDLGVDPATAELLAKELQLVWDGKQLMYLAGAFHDGDLPQAVASALMGVWHFKSFSESRWLTVGTSCRTMVAAFLTGICSLVQLVKKESSTLFFLRGFDRLTGRKVEFMTICAVASRIPEALQCELMRDNRVAQTADWLWETAAKMMRWTIDLPESTFALLGELCDRPGCAMKDMCISAAHIAFHFSNRRVLVEAGELPWRLVRGDIAHNLQELASCDCPEEPVSKNLWLLMQRSFPRSQLIQTVKMLGEVGWTSLPAEQQHSSLASLHKWHPEYETETLVSRALLLQASKLLPSMSKEEKAAARLSAKLQHILRACPQKVSGRNMLVASMLRICAEKKDLGMAGYGGSLDIIHRRCIGRHIAFWAQQSLAQQHEWRDQARRKAGARQHLLNIEWQVLSAELANVESEICEQKLAPPALSMSAAALTDDDIETFGRLYSQPGFGDSMAMALRRADVGHAPVQFVQRYAGPPMWRRPEPAMPAWATPFIEYRGTFSGSALVVQGEDGARSFWKIVFAVKSPRYLALCPLHPVPLPSVYDLDIPQPQLGPEFAFSINYADCISAADVVVGPKGQLSCLFRLMHEGGTRVASDMQPIALEYVLCGDACDIGPAQEHGDGEAEPVAKADQAFEKIVATTMPWLQFLDFKHPLTGESAAGHGEADETEDDVDEVQMKIISGRGWPVWSGLVLPRRLHQQCYRIATS